jgi:hypothetical protein
LHCFPVYYPCPLSRIAVNSDQKPPLSLPEKRDADPANCRFLTPSSKGNFVLASCVDFIPSRKNSSEVEKKLSQDEAFIKADHKRAIAEVNNKRECYFKSKTCPKLRCLLQAVTGISYPTSWKKEQLVKIAVETRDLKISTEFIDLQDDATSQTMGLFNRENMKLIICQVTAIEFCQYCMFD